MRHTKAIVLSLFSLVLIAKLTAQPLPDSTIKKIDDLAGSKVKGSDPGFAIGIIQHDSLVSWNTSLDNSYCITAQNSLWT